MTNNPSCVNVYGGITRWGATDLIMVTGTSNYIPTCVNSRGKKAKNITCSEYKEVCYQLVHEGSRLFSS